jgi:hypothetical protein
MAEITSSLLVINLDFRIFCLTIMLSVVLLSIAVMEYLVSFKIIDIQSINEWKFLLYYAITESLPTITIACFLSSPKYSDGDTQQMPLPSDRQFGYYSSETKSDNQSKQKQRRSKKQPK